MQGAPGRAHRRCRSSELTTGSGRRPPSSCRGGSRARRLPSIWRTARSQRNVVVSWFEACVQPVALLWRDALELEFDLPDILVPVRTGHAFVLDEASPARIVAPQQSRVRGIVEPVRPPAEFVLRSRGDLFQSDSSRRAGGGRQGRKTRGGSKERVDRPHEFVEPARKS